MRFLKHAKHYVIPSKKNAYRPHLLGRSWLVFFLAVVMAVEGFLVADLVVRQSSQTYLAAVASASVLPAAPTPATTMHSLTQSIERRIARLAAEPQRSADGVLGVLGVVLVVLIALAFFIHIDIQPVNMLAGGALVAALAFSFIFINGRFLGAGINNLHTGQAGVIVSVWQTKR